MSLAAPDLSSHQKQGLDKSAELWGSIMVGAFEDDEVKCCISVVQGVPKASTRHCQLAMMQPALRAEHALPRVT